MTDDSIYWVSLNFDHIPTAAEIDEVADSLRDGLDHELIVTTEEVKPLNKDELKEWLDELREAVSDDE